MKVYYHSRPLNGFLVDQLTKIDERARHVAFIVDTSEYGLVKFEYDSKGLHYASIRDCEINDQQWVVKMGETTLSLVQIIILSTEWARHHPYQYNDDNCRAFVDYSLREMLHEQWGKSNRNSFVRSPCEVAESIIVRERSSMPGHIYPTQCSNPIIASLKVDVPPAQSMRSVIRQATPSEEIIIYTSSDVERNVAKHLGEFRRTLVSGRRMAELAFPEAKQLEKIKKLEKLLKGLRDYENFREGKSHQIAMDRATDYLRSRMYALKPGMFMGVELCTLFVEHCTPHRSIEEERAFIRTLHQPIMDDLKAGRINSWQAAIQLQGVEQFALGMVATRMVQDFSHLWQNPGEVLIKIVPEFIKRPFERFHDAVNQAHDQILMLQEEKIREFSSKGLDYFETDSNCPFNTYETLLGFLSFLGAPVVSRVELVAHPLSESTLVELPPDPFAFVSSLPFEKSAFYRTEEGSEPDLPASAPRKRISNRFSGSANRSDAAFSQLSSAPSNEKPSIEISPHVSMTPGQVNVGVDLKNAMPHHTVNVGMELTDDQISRVFNWVFCNAERKGHIDLHGQRYYYEVEGRGWKQTLSVYQKDKQGHKCNRANNPHQTEQFELAYFLSRREENAKVFLKTLKKCISPLWEMHFNNDYNALMNDIDAAFLREDLPQVERLQSTFFKKYGDLDSLKCETLRQIAERKNAYLEHKISMSTASELSLMRENPEYTGYAAQINLRSDTLQSFEIQRALEKGDFSTANRECDKIVDAVLQQQKRKDIVDEALASNAYDIALKTCELMPASEERAAFENEARQGIVDIAAEEMLKTLSGEAEHAPVLESMVDQLSAHYQRRREELIQAADPEIRIHSQKGLHLLRALVALDEEYLAQKEEDKSLVREGDTSTYNSDIERLKCAELEAIFFWIQSSQILLDVGFALPEILFSFLFNDKESKTQRHQRLQKLKIPLSLILQLGAHHYAWQIRQLNTPVSTASIFTHYTRYPLLVAQLCRVFVDAFEWAGFPRMQKTIKFSDKYTLPAVQLILSMGVMIEDPKNLIHILGHLLTSKGKADEEQNLTLLDNIGRFFNYLNHLNHYGKTLSVWLERMTGIQSVFPTETNHLHYLNSAMTTTASVVNTYYFQPRRAAGEAPEHFFPILGEGLCQLANHPVSQVLYFYVEHAELINTAAVSSAAVVANYIPQVIGDNASDVASAIGTVAAGIKAAIGVKMMMTTGVVVIAGGSLWYYNHRWYHNRIDNIGVLLASGKPEACLAAKNKIAEIQRYYPSDACTRNFDTKLKEEIVSKYSIQAFQTALVDFKKVFHFLSDVHARAESIKEQYSAKGLKKVKQYLENNLTLQVQNEFISNFNHFESSANEMKKIPAYLKQVLQDLTEVNKQLKAEVALIEAYKPCSVKEKQRHELLIKHYEEVLNLFTKIQADFKRAGLNDFFSKLDKLIASDDFTYLTQLMNKQYHESVRRLKDQAVVHVSSHTMMSCTDLIFDYMRLNRAKRDRFTPNWSLETVFVKPKETKRSVPLRFHESPQKQPVNFKKSASPVTPLFFKPLKTSSGSLSTGARYATK